jgi:hypothetical protein
VRSIDFSDGFTSAGAPTGGAVSATSLASYATDAAYVSAKGSAAANGDTYYNSTYHALRCYQNSAWHFLRVADVINAASDSAFVTAKGSAAADGDIYLQSTDKVLRAMINSAWRSLTDSSPNYVINGNMDFWQRGTSQTSTSTTRIYGSADRWSMFSGSAATTSNMSRSTSVPTPVGTSGGAQYSLQLQRVATGTGTTGSFAAQAIESNTVYAMRGKTITLSFWAKAGANFSAASSQMEVGLHSGTVADEVPSSAYTGSVGLVNLVLLTISTTWTRYEYTVVVPTTSLELRIRFGFYGVGTAGADDSISITQVMLSEGGTGRPFIHHGGSLANELTACQRYFEKSYNTTTTPGAGTSSNAVAFRASGTSVEYFIQFNVSKRTTSSTMAMYSTDGTVAKMRDVTGSTNVNATITTNQGDSGVYATKTTGGTDQSRYDFHWTADAEI